MIFLDNIDRHQRSGLKRSVRRRKRRQLRLKENGKKSNFVSAVTLLKIRDFTGKTENGRTQIFQKK